MNHVIYYPDLITENKTYGDPKGHYIWGKQYYELAKAVFPPSRIPHFIEGEEYENLGLSICARKGVRYVFV